MTPSRLHALTIVILSQGASGCAGRGPSAKPVDSGGEDSAAPGATWAAALDATGLGSLSGVRGSAPDDVWVVGGDENSGRSIHFDGAAWVEVPLPAGTPLLAWVHAWSPTAAMAVGVDGAAVWWDGAAWSTLQTGTTEDLWGVFGFGPEEVWVVGGDADAGDPLILTGPPQALAPMALDPDANPRGATTLFKVWGVDGALWLVGQYGTLLQRSGVGWVAVSGGAEANQDFIGIDGLAPDALTVVGGRGNARVAHPRSDGSWETLAPSGIGGLSAVAHIEGGAYVVGGVAGYAGRFDPSTGLIEDEAFLGTETLHSAWSDGAGRTYMVGGTFAPPHRGAAWVRTAPGAR